MFNDLMRRLGGACCSAVCLLTVEAMDSMVGIKEACDYVANLSLPTEKVVSIISEQVPSVDRYKVPSELWNEIVDDKSKIKDAVSIGKSVDKISQNCIQSIKDRSRSVHASIMECYSSFWKFSDSEQFAALALLYQYTNEMDDVTYEEITLAGSLFVYLFKRLIDRRSCSL